MHERGEGRSASEVSEVSEASEASPCAERRRYRVRVCLRRFFDDERARCYVWVCATRRVRWLAWRLRRLFALPAPLVLLSQGHLLPPDEPLALLAPDDLVDVIPSTGERHVERKSIADEINTNCSDEIDATAYPLPHKRTRRAAVTTAPPATPALPAPHSPPVSYSSDSSLHRLSEMKQHALSLLDGVAGAAASPSPPPHLPHLPHRPRRRRVRRRRAPRADAHTDETMTAESETGLVRRNCHAHPRAPRTVPALPPASPAPALPPASAPAAPAAPAAPRAAS